MKKYCALALGIAGVALLSVPAQAADFEVKMLNKGSDGQVMMFEPAFLRVQPGDTVRFIPTDKGHDAETIPGMLPDGAQPFKGKLSEELKVTFQTPGLYGYRCLPHFGMGMVGLIAVGNTAPNLYAVRQVKIPPAPAKRMAVLLDQSQRAEGSSSTKSAALH
ncbi:pseudoazurin [[Pseudomonas] carboxydohydrogena]|uniref:Pseudoazurin n=1 Tax=Afipia carboxydohydrogena TaxID=290 RepID=A0ABY8BLW2_AFICR|nr:pseudoazurin [[Pseudomonas] carboxydohydrogena]WEF50980.1 pseudoazurin [[Pseudomonas] carboxydohydrogena]